MNFIGIKQLWYGDLIKEAPTEENIKTWISSATEVKNVHNDTWGYSQSEPEKEEYKNELTGKNYHVDEKTGAIPTVNFTLGEYTLQDKETLQGGKVTGKVWASPTSHNPINKGVVALSKTGNYIVFPKAEISASGSMVQKNIGLAVKAVALETGLEGVSDEYWIEGAKE